MKLLINYDIKETDSDEDIIEYIKSQTDWVHLQLSSWIVETSLNKTTMYEKILSLLGKETKSKVAVFDITKQAVSANLYTGEKKNENSKRLFTESV